MTMFRSWALSATVILTSIGCTTERLDATFWLTDGQSAEGPSDAAVLDSSPAEGAVPEGAVSSDAYSDAYVPIGSLRVSGSRIVDSTGKPIHITGVTWHGLETSNFAPAGLWIRSLADLTSQIRALSYNSVRFTISFRLLDPDALTQGISAQVNPDLNGLTGLQMLDRVVDEAERNQLRVILCQQGWAADAEEELWFNAAHNEDEWVDRWRTLALRYQKRPTVIGFELHNAPRNSATVNPSWGDGGPADWWAAATRAGNAILAANPDVLVFVDGVQQIGTDGYWWGGNLAGVEQKRVDLDVPNRVVYATHEYPKTIFDQPWFSTDANYFENLPPVWDKYWGYLVERDLAPVWIAEFGTAEELPWLQQILDYATSRGAHFAYRAFNPNTDPRIGGILRDDWQTVNEDRQALLAPTLGPIIP
jgi:aryl-phospho-beta-D-glucosidase BglC (GH1 family)